MTRITVSNLSPLRREHWTQVRLPIKESLMLNDDCRFTTDDGRVFLATKGRTTGKYTTFYVNSVLEGNQSLQGKIINRDESDLQLGSEPYRLHPWVDDDIAKLGRFTLEVDGVNSQNPLAWGLIEVNHYHTRWVGESFNISTGLKLVVYADVYHNDPVVDITGCVVWSNRLSASPNAVFGSIKLRSGEELVLRHSAQKGFQYAGLIDGDYTTILGRNIPFKDGSAFRFAGSLLCRDDSKEATNNDNYYGNLEAASQGHTRAIAESMNHEGNWLAFGHAIPRNPNYSIHLVTANMKYSEFLRERNDNFLRPRPLGASQNPAMTGEQEDHASTKGEYVVGFEDPELIDLYEYSAEADLLRGGMLLESNGGMLLAKNHPNWVTWNMATHSNPSVSKDRLGKTGNAQHTTGWVGYDAQHKSQNTLAAYLALVDDPIMFLYLKHLMQIDLRDYRRVYPTYGVDSPRGQGRPLAAWAHLYTVTGDQDYLTLIRAQAEQSLKYFNTRAPGKPMQPLGWGGADNRKPVYLNEVLAPFVSVWEHALAIVGLYAAYKVLPGDENVERLMNVTSRFIADWALFEAKSGIELIVDMAWNNGNSYVFDYTSDTPNIIVDRKSGVGAWASFGVVIAREWLGTKDPKYDIMSKFVIPRFKEYTSWDSPWLAAVKMPLT